MSRRLSLTTVTVLQAVASGCRFGLAVMRETGLPSGTVYPVLARAEESGWVRGSWEQGDDGPHDVGRPRRRYYELTSQGSRALQDALEKMVALFGSRVRGLVRNE